MEYKLTISLWFALVLTGCSCRHQMQSTIKNTKTEVKNNRNTKLDTTMSSYEKLTYRSHNIIKLVRNETGQYYIKLLPGNKNVIDYLFKQDYKDATNIKDRFYSERILFEWDGKLKNTELYNEDLQQVNLIVNHYRFRNMGTLRIKKGFLKIKKIARNTFNIHIKIDEDIDGLVIREIDKTIVINENKR